MKEYLKQILSISAICIFLRYGCGPAHTSTKYDANGEILNDGYSSIVSSDNSQPISKKTKEERHYNNVYELLETVSGVFVDGRTVRVRGINSVNGNTAPLILMDGNEINLDLINPEALRLKICPGQTLTTLIHKTPLPNTLLTTTHMQQAVKPTESGS